MNLKVKIYVVEETKTFTFVIKNVSKQKLTNLFYIFLVGEMLFDFRMNKKSNTLSFYTSSLDDLEGFKRIINNCLKN